MLYYLAYISHYLLASLAAVIIYSKFGKTAVICFGLIFLAFKAYEKCRYWSRGESVSVYDASGNLEKWTFVGTDFSVVADLRAMTFNLKARCTEVTDTSSIITSEWKSRRGKTDMTIPLPSASILLNNAFRYKTVSNTKIVQGYRLDGSFGPGYHVDVHTTTANTGGKEFILFVNDGYLQESGDATKKRRWVRSGRFGSKQQVSVLKTVSSRQAQHFLEGWDKVEGEIANRLVK